MRWRVLPRAVTRSQAPEKAMRGGGPLDRIRAIDFSRYPDPQLRLLERIVRTVKPMLELQQEHGRPGIWLIRGGSYPTRCLAKATHVCPLDDDPVLVFQSVAHTPAVVWAA